MAEIIKWKNMAPQVVEKTRTQALQVVEKKSRIENMLPNPFLVHPLTHLSEQGVLEWEAEEECTNMEGAAHCTGEERRGRRDQQQAKPRHQLHLLLQT